MILQYESLTVSDILENSFPNITLDKIGNLLPLIGGSLKGDCDHHPWSDGENGLTSHAIFGIEMMRIYYKPLV